MRLVEQWFPMSMTCDSRDSEIKDSLRHREVDGKKTSGSFDLS